MIGLSVTRAPVPSVYWSPFGADLEQNVLHDREQAFVLPKSINVITAFQYAKWNAAPSHYSGTMYSSTNDKRFKFFNILITYFQASMYNS